jgi:orotidine 5'-phosphate decarboxylase subfamily 2
MDVVGDIRGARSFVSQAIEDAMENVCAFKANAAFYLQFGSAGWQLLEDLRKLIPKDRIFIVDAKMGDIGNTSAAYARAVFEVVGADAVTLNPLMGSEVIDPFLQYENTGVFLVGRSSNPSSIDLIDNPKDVVPLYERIIDLAATYPAESVGLVVGATSGGALIRCDQLAGGRFFLVPGLGAQDGEVEAVRGLIERHQAPIVVSVSRGIAADPDGVLVASHRWKELLARTELPVP